MCNNYTPYYGANSACGGQQQYYSPQNFQGLTRQFQMTAADALPANPRYITQQPSYGLPGAAEQFSDDVEMMGGSFSAGVYEGAGEAVTIAGFDATAPQAQYINTGGGIGNYLNSVLGQMIRVEFLLADTVAERTGILSEVGDGYIVLSSQDGSSRLLCDINAVRFVAISQNGFSQNGCAQSE